MRPTLDRKLNRNKGGFTLVELMVAIVIFSILGSLLTMVVSTGSVFFSEENSQIDNQLDLTSFSLMMEKDIRSTLSLSSSSGCLVLNKSTSSVTYCFISTTKSITRNGVVLTKRVNTMTFSVLGTQLKIDIQSIPDRRGDVNTYHQTYVLREGNY